MESLKDYGLKAVAQIGMDQEKGPKLKWETSLDGETSVKEMIAEFYTMFMVGMHRDILPKAIVFEDKNVVVSSYKYNLLCLFLKRGVDIESFMTYAESIMNKYSGNPSKLSCLRSLAARVNQFWKKNQ
ncbi:MAG: hypothetical protein Q6366_002400 [Candidatus Freyarchaeota archaeon]